MKAAIIYQSKTGTTKKYAEEIESYLQNKGIEATLISIQEYKDEMIQNIDYLFLGCWTSGLFFFLQHPDKEWVEFAKKLPKTLSPKLALFTTYKLLTGSMYGKMYKHLKGKFQKHAIELKSKYGKLSIDDKSVIDKFIVLI
jgi:flavodoxin